MRPLKGDLVFFTLTTSVRVPSCEGRVDFLKQILRTMVSASASSFTNIRVYLPSFALIFSSASVENPMHRISGPNCIAFLENRGKIFGNKKVSIFPRSSKTVVVMGQEVIEPPGKEEPKLT